MRSLSYKDKTTSEYYDVVKSGNGINDDGEDYNNEDNYNGGYFSENYSNLTDDHVEYTMLTSLKEDLLESMRNVAPPLAGISVGYWLSRYKSLPSRILSCAAGGALGFGMPKVYSLFFEGNTKEETG